jgi:hypothetical protein
MTSDMDGNTLQQIGGDSEAIEILKTKEPAAIFLLLSKKIDQVLTETRRLSDQMEKTHKSLFDPREGLHGRVQNIEEWKAQLLRTVEEKIKACRDTCMIENGNVRMNNAEIAIQQIRKYHWLIVSIVATGSLGYLLKVVFPLASAAASSL